MGFQDIGDDDKKNSNNIIILLKLSLKRIILNFIIFKNRKT